MTADAKLIQGEDGVDGCLGLRAAPQSASLGILGRTWRRCKAESMASQLIIVYNRGGVNNSPAWPTRILHDAHELHSPQANGFPRAALARRWRSIIAPAFLSTA